MLDERRRAAQKALRGQRGSPFLPPFESRRSFYRQVSSARPQGFFLIHIVAELGPMCLLHISAPGFIVTTTLYA